METSLSFTWEKTCTSKWVVLSYLKEMQKAEQMHKEEVEPNLPRRLIKSQRMFQNGEKKNKARKAITL